MTGILKLSTPSTILVLLSVVHSALLAPPPTTTPTFPTTTAPFPTTLPSACRTNEGDQLFPGQEKTYYEEGACRVCSCSWGGSVNCYYGDCLPPMCVEPHRRPGACCATCPNGRNCKIQATGEIIKAGLPVERMGMVCTCPSQSHMLPGLHLEEHYTAICTPATTIPFFTTNVPVGRR